MNRSAARRSALVAATLALPLLAVTLFAPVYQTNDDVAMRLLAEGKSAFLLLINVIPGEVLSLLYRVAPAMPWYDLMLGALQTAAAGALLFVWSGPGSRDEWLWTTLFALFLLLPVFVNVQFTVVAMTCAAAGIALLLHATRRLQLVAGALLFVAGSLIRFEGAMLIAIAGALLAWPLWRRDAVVAACAAVVVAIVLFAINVAVYRQSAGWDEFHEYHLHRTHLSEFVAYEQITPAALRRLRDEVGWSGNDLALLRDWFFADREVYSLERVRRADAIFGNRPDLRRARELVSTFLYDNRWVLLLLAAFALARGARVYGVAAAATLVVLVAGVSYVLKPPPPHVTFPLLILLATTLTIAARRWEQKPRAWRTVLAVVIAVWVAGPSTKALYRKSIERRATVARVRRDVAALKATGAQLFVLHGSAFPYESYWRPLRAEMAPFAFISLGGDTRMPPTQDLLRRYGITDLPSAICSDPRLVLVAHPHTPPMLATFLREHRHFDVRFERVLHAESFDAWRCAKASAINS